MLSINRVPERLGGVKVRFVASQCSYAQTQGGICYFRVVMLMSTYAENHAILNNHEARERSEPTFSWFSKGKKPLHNGSYEHRVSKIQDLIFFCTRDVHSLICLFICVIQHRNWPLRSTILNAHGTNASPDGLCTRRHTNEAFSCWFCCNSFRVDRARRGKRVFIMRPGRRSEATEAVF